MKFRIFRDLFLHRLGLERCYKPQPLVRHPELQLKNVMDWAIEKHLLNSRDFFFVQIGGFDGVHNDGLFSVVRKHKLKGIIVEPQPKAFERLKINYADQPQLSLVNAAVARECGVQKLYTLRDSDSSVASFDINHLRRHNFKPEQIVGIDVPCVTIDRLLADHGDPRVDLVQIDTEGFDFEVLKMIDLKLHQPSIIRYEQLHLSTRDRDDAARLLADHGYRFMTDRQDVLAYRDAA